MTTKSERSKTVQPGTLKKVFWRAFLLPSCYSMDRMQAPGFAYSMIPVIRDLYGDDPEKEKEALVRHSAVYNNTYAMSPFVLGITTAMEEQAASDENFDVSMINNVKVALMGPLSAIGDTFFWGTFRILATGVAIGFSAKGSILGPILFLLIYNLPHILVRIYGLKAGYKLGGDSIEALSKGGLMSKATKAATILGLVVIGGMIASMVGFSLNWVIQMGDISFNVQEDLFDAICPKVLPLLLTFGVYHLLKKNVKPVIIMLILIALAIVLTFFGVM